MAADRRPFSTPLKSVAFPFPPPNWPFVSHPRRPLANLFKNRVTFEAVFASAFGTFLLARFFRLGPKFGEAQFVNGDDAGATDA